MQFCIHKEDASRRSGLHHIGKIKHFFSNRMKKIRKFFMRIKIVRPLQGTLDFPQEGDDLRQWTEMIEV